MSYVTVNAADRVIYRKSVTYCVLPIDLGRHLDELKRYYADTENIEMLVERRGSGDRRQTADEAPSGVERRLGERRDVAALQTASAGGMELPRSLRRHAERIIVTRRSVPVHFQDAAHEADALLAAADTDTLARDELRLRYHPRVYAGVCRSAPRRHALELTDSVFDDLFSHHESNRFDQEVSRATGRVLAARR